MFAIWVDTWLSGTPVAARKIRNPGQQRGQCKSGTSQQAGEAKKWHFIACDCVIEILYFQFNWKEFTDSEGSHEGAY